MLVKNQINTNIHQMGYKKRIFVSNLLLHVTSVTGISVTSLLPHNYVHFHDCQIFLLVKSRALTEVTVFSSYSQLEYNVFIHF